jgi:selenocysteine lyase/cysteine desulfurase
MTENLDRRGFARLLTLGAAGALVRARGAEGSSGAPPWQRPPATLDERFWQSVRAEFLMPRTLAVLNAANLCPSPQRVIGAAFDSTRSVERDPSSQNRQRTREGREAARRAIADALRVTPEEIVITRNTSEANNFVSSGLDLEAGDEVLVLSDNHPSNHAAWREKAKRFGYSVRTIDQVNPHPGPEYYIDAFTRAMTPATRVVALTHVTASVGDLMPAREICRAARERGILSLVDGAQSFGVLDVDLSDIQPDFYTGSAHKWPCGPKETGVLYVNQRAHGRISPSVVSLYPGAVGISRTLEAFGQRDEPAIIGFGEAIAFQSTIGRRAIETRARELTSMLAEGLKKIDGVKVWTHAAAERSAAIVSFQPANLDIRRLHDTLYEKDGVVCATRGGSDRPGLRFSPHFYNTHEDIERALAAVAKYVRSGV